MNQDQQDKDIIEVVENTSNKTPLAALTIQDEISLEELEAVSAAGMKKINVNQLIKTYL